MMGELDQIRRIAEDVYQNLSSGYSEEGYDRAIQVGLRGHTSGARTAPGVDGRSPRGA